MGSDDGENETLITSMLGGSDLTLIMSSLVLIERTTQTGPRLLRLTAIAAGMDTKD
jgi:hypothetical protein